MTQTATLRNVGVNMVVASEQFAGMPALAVVMWNRQARTGIAGGAKS